MQTKELSSRSGCQREENVSLTLNRPLSKKKSASRTRLSSAITECQCECLSTKKKSSKTFVQVSIINSQFYDHTCKVISSHLLSPTEIDSAVSDLSCLNSSSRGGEVKSWFVVNQRIATSVNSRKICSQYFTKRHAEDTDLVSAQVFPLLSKCRYRLSDKRLCIVIQTILRRWEYHKSNRIVLHGFHLLTRCLKFTNIAFISIASS